MFFHANSKHIIKKYIQVTMVKIPKKHNSMKPYGTYQLRGCGTSTF